MHGWGEKREKRELWVLYKCYWTRKAVNSVLFVFLGFKSVHYSGIELLLSILHDHEMIRELPERGKEKKETKAKKEQDRTYKQLSISVSFEAAARPLRIAPSTCGLTQKSPQMANLFFLSQRHFCSLDMLAVGKALPLETYQAMETMKWTV